MKIVLVILVFVFAFVTGSHISISNTQSHEEIVAYWTAERRAEAEANSRSVHVEFNEEARAAAEAFMEDSPIDQEPTPTVVEEGWFPDARTSANENNTTHAKRGYPFPFTSGTNTNNAQPWYNLVGRLYVNIPGDVGPLTCTATIIRPNVIMTTGFCVYVPQKGWGYNFIFYPGYPQNPYGSFVWHTAHTNTFWTGTRDYCKDYGFLTIQPQASGLRVGDWGFFGYMFNAGLYDTNLRYRTLGYYSPATTATQNYIADYHYYTDSPYGQTSPGTTTGAYCIAVGRDDCNQGGPWIFNWGTSYLVNGINAYKDGYMMQAMFSPYFDSGWFDIMNLAISAAT